MFKRVLVHELKNIARDKMYLFLAAFSLIMATVSLFLIPYLRDQSSDMVADIFIVVFIMMSSFYFGAITGFTLLDDQDDLVLFSLKITPIHVRDYILIKIALCYIFGFITTILIIITSGLISSANLLDLVYISILAPMQGPILALLINSFATNKVEGFVYMKLSGIILMAPIAALFIFNWTELLLGFLPGFWSTRIVTMQLLPNAFFIDSTFIYFILGLIVNGLIGLLFFKLYTKRVNI